MFQGKAKLVTGILGVKRDLRKPVIFSFAGEEWPSDDSEDMDYSPEDAKPSGNQSVIDSVIEGNEPVKQSVNLQRSPSNCRETLDSGTDVKWNPNVVVNGSKMIVPLKETKDTWVVSASNRKEGMTLKLNLLKGNGSVKRKRERSALKKKQKVERKKRGKFDAAKKPRNSQKSIVANCETVTNSVPPCAEGFWGQGLPEEVLVKIFRHVVAAEGVVPFLSRASKVCTLWKKAAQSSCLWERVDLSWCRVKNEDALIRLCKNHLSRTRELNLAGWGNSLTIRSITAIAEHCPLLSSVILSHCTKISANCIKLLADSCPDLSSVDLCGVAQKYGSMTSPLSFACLKHLFEKCGKHLTHLLLAENVMGNFPTIMKTVGELCPNLQMLDMSNLSSASALCLPLESLQHGCTSLRVLRLANSSIALSPTTLATQAKAPGFPELEELSIAVEGNFGVSLGDDDLDRIVKTSCKLKLLDVRGCRCITASGLIRVPAWDMQHLFLSQCDASRMPDLELVLRKWSHSLKEVDLSWASNDEAINQGVVALSASDCQSPLLTLDLHGSSISYRTIKILLSRCSLLYSLNLQSCRGLPRGMKRLYVNDDLCRLRADISEGRLQDDPDDD